MGYLDYAQDRLWRYFSDQQYDLYDGVPVAQDDTLTVSDLLVSVALNSQLNTRNKIWHVWKYKGAVEQILPRISSDISLDSDRIPWPEIHALFEAFCRIKYAKEAVATKILHKKRPRLIPIYDQYVWEHFERVVDHTLWRRGGAPFLISYMQAFREELITNKAIIADLHTFTHNQGWSITPVRILEVLIWIEYEPTKYYQ
jgi:hypothetical protein